MCLINATATDIEPLVRPCLGYFPLLDSYWLDNIYPAPIGPLLQAALEHASVCLINATATGTEIPKSLILSYLCFFPYSPPIGWTLFTLLPLVNYCRLPWSTPACALSAPRLPLRCGDTQVLGPVRLLFFPLLASYWLGNILPCSHWSIIAGCLGACQRVPNQRHSHRYGDTQVSGSVRTLFFLYLPPIGWTLFTLLPLVNYCRLPWSTPACALSTPRLPLWCGDTQVLGPVRLLFFPLLASYWLGNILPCSHWSIISGCLGACQRVPNQGHGHRYGDTQVPGSVCLYLFPYSLSIGWTIFYPASIGQLLQVALEHASVCLINATATGTEILKSLVLPGLGSFTILDANKEYFTLFSLTH